MAIKTYKKGDSTKIATNFRAKEFDCQGRGCCTTTPIDEKLVEYLQQIRDHFDKPVHLTAYRCKTHNAKTPNAASNSYHCYGQAADFHIDGVSPAEIAKYAESIGIKGIGLYDDFVHIDTRETKSFWQGHNQKRVSTFGAEPIQEEYTLFDFICEVQEACGAVVDGKVGSETISKTPALSSKANNAHPAVKPVQKRLLALGYTEVGKTDGLAGVKFDSALAHFQQDNGCYVNGELNEWDKTWHKLLGMDMA